MSQVSVENASKCSIANCPLCATKYIYCPSGIRWLTFCRHNMEIEYFKRPAALGTVSRKEGTHLFRTVTTSWGESHVGGR